MDSAMIEDKHLSVVFFSVDVSVNMNCSCVIRLYCAAHIWKCSIESQRKVSDVVAESVSTKGRTSDVEWKMGAKGKKIHSGGNHYEESVCVCVSGSLR